MIQLTPPASSPSQPTYSVRNVALPNGIELNYVTQGTPEGVPVVLLHGLSDSWRSFEFLLSHMPQTVHAFALSLRGHGDTGRLESGYGTGDLAEDVAVFMDMRDIDAGVIVGHSMGSLVAQRFALDYPERVLGLVLLGAVWSLHTVPEIEELHAAIGSLTDPVDPEFVRAFQLSTIAQPVPPPTSTPSSRRA